MELNLTIEVISGFLVSSVIIIASILSYIKLKHIKLKSLFFLRLSFLLAGLYFFFEALADLFLNVYLATIYNLLLPLMPICFLIGITYSKKETGYSIVLLILLFFLPIYLIFTFLPSSYEIILVPGFEYQKILTPGILDLLIFLDYIVIITLGIHWGILIWKNTPFFYKNVAFLLLFSLLIIIPISVLLYLLIFIHPTFIIFSDIILALGWYIIILAITREPKLLYILPFTVHRILVKDQEGYHLFDHDWSDNNIDENIFTGFINAVQLMSEEIMQIGAPLDINLQEGILIIKNSKYITVGLIASKSSKLLRDCINNFTHDFEMQFESLLKASCKEEEKYESAYYLIDKYFSNFPYRIITNKTFPLLISAKYSKIPLQIDNKYNQIFESEVKIEKIKAELLRFPVSSHDDFLKLYEELKDEKEVNFDYEEMDKLEDN